MWPLAASIAISINLFFLLLSFLFLFFIFLVILFSPFIFSFAMDNE